MADASKEKGKNTPKYASKDELEQLGSVVGELADLVKGMREDIKLVATQTKPAETPLDREIKKAAPDEDVVPRAWQEKAEEYIGDALDHVEVKHLKNGGMIFTIIVKRDKSNAPQDYLERYGSDRRSKEVSTEGIAGVEEWCKLVKANLARPR